MKFVINKNDKLNPGHNHEVHRPGCPYYPTSKNRIYLGEFIYAQTAVQHARTYYFWDADGCKTCCPEAHHE